ncbi:MAG: hypothetical protein Q9190_004903 [Brigantiaea leucoxantha]
MYRLFASPNSDYLPEFTPDFANTFFLRNIPPPVKSTFDSLPKVFQEDLVSLSEEYERIVNECNEQVVLPTKSLLVQNSEFYLIEKSEDLCDIMQFSLYKYRNALRALEGSPVHYLALIEKEKDRILAKQGSSTFKQVAQGYSALLSDMALVMGQRNPGGKKLEKHKHERQKKEARVFYAVDPPGNTTNVENNILNKLKLPSQKKNAPKKNKDSGKNAESKNTTPQNATLQKSKDMWCPVLQRFGKDCVMAHLIPKKLQDQNLALILGVGSESTLLYNKRAVLFMYTGIEKEYDRGKVAFIPEPKQQGREEEPTELRVVLVDQSIEDRLVGEDRGLDGKSLTFGKLHGRSLQFLNDNRPSLRLLYLHALVCYQKARTDKWFDYENLERKLFTGEAWGTPGGIGLETILGKLAQYVANDALIPKIVAASFIDDNSPLGQVQYKREIPRVIEDAMLMAESISGASAVMLMPFSFQGYHHIMKNAC